MNQHRIAALAMAAMTLSAAARAQAPATPPPADCTTLESKAAGLHIVRNQLSLADLAVDFAPSQAGKFAFRGGDVLEGDCAQHVYAFRMSRLVFDDGAVFANRSKDQFVHAPGVTWLAAASGEPLATAHPDIEQAQFIMSFSVDIAYGGKRFLDVGLWKKHDAYLVAAFTRHDGGLTAPIALFQSTVPIKSVTYFPAPDTNTGRLGMLQATTSGIALLSLDWDHRALSKALRTEN